MLMQLLTMQIDKGDYSCAKAPEIIGALANNSEHLTEQDAGRQPLPPPFDSFRTRLARATNDRDSR